MQKLVMKEETYVGGVVFCKNAQQGSQLEPPLIFRDALTVKKFMKFHLILI
jgi:hypothetical protein